MTIYRSPLAKAKNSGSARSGSDQWLKERISALLLAILSVWFIVNLFCSFKNPELTINKILYTPFHFLAFLAFINIALYHTCVGMKVVYEDYVHCEFKKNTLILVTYLINYVTMIAFSFILMTNFIINI